MPFFAYSLSLIVIVSLLATIIYSIKARREQNVKQKGLLTARMNIAMGVMLTAMAGVQIFLFSGSTIRLAVGVVFLLLGLFNLFAGIRNHAVFNARK